jgi:hypothetical protein
VAKSLEGLSQAHGEQVVAAKSEFATDCRERGELASSSHSKKDNRTQHSSK